MRANQVVEAAGRSSVGGEVTRPSKPKWHRARVSRMDGSEAAMEWILRITSETGAGLLARRGLTAGGDELGKNRVGARERTRTSTTLRSLAPEASASASSATRARAKRAGLDGSQPLARHFSFCPRAGPLSTRAASGGIGSHAPAKTLKNKECRSVKRSPSLLSLKFLYIC